MSKSALCIVADAGSYSIKALAVRVAKDSVLPKILDKKFLKLPVSDGDGLLTADSQTRIISKLQELVSSMAQKGNFRPERMLVGVGSVMTDLVVEEWKMKLVKQGLLAVKDLIGYFENLKKQHQTQGAETGVFPLKVLINGYEVGFKDMEVPKNSELAFRVLLAKFSPELARAKENLGKSFGGVRVEFIPLLYLEQLFLAEGLGAHNAVLLDVGGESTTLALLKEGALADVRTFPLGGRHFLRGAAKIVNLTEEETEDLKRQYSQGVVGESRRKQVRDFLMKEAKEWQKMLASAVENFYHHGPLPEQVFIFGGGANIPEINIAAREGIWIKNISQLDYPKVNVLGGEAVFEGDTLDGLVCGPQDIGLASSIFYLQKIF